MSRPTSKATRARPFRETRRHHSTEAAEDYSELIADLIEEQGEARTCTIAQELGVSHVTALRTIRRLQDEGYMVTAPHKPVELTAKGKRTARYARDRHQLVVRFLEHIGVPTSVAEIDAEGAEHHMSQCTLDCIRNFLEFNSDSAL